MRVKIAPDEPLNIYIVEGVTQDIVTGETSDRRITILDDGEYARFGKPHNNWTQSEGYTSANQNERRFVRLIATYPIFCIQLENYDTYSKYTNVWWYADQAAKDVGNAELEFCDNPEDN